MSPNQISQNAESDARGSALRIKIGIADGGRLEFRCSGSQGESEPVGCCLRPGMEVSNWRRELGDELQAIKKLVGNKLTLAPGAKLSKAVGALQETGDRFAGMLFGFQLPRISELLKKACPEWEAAGSPSEAPDAQLTPIIIVEGPLAHMLPLELLPLFRADSGGNSRPPVNIDSEATLRGALREFVGFTAIVHRVAAESGDPRSSNAELRCAPRLLVKLFVNRALKGVRNEIAFLEKHAELDLDIWPQPRRRGTPRDLAHHLWHTRHGTDRQPRAADSSDQIHHFACHVNTPNRKPHEIILAGCGRTESRVPLRKLDSEFASLVYAPLPCRDARPLVVMNACGTCRIDPDGVTSLPNIFLNKFRCRGFIGTETTMSDAVAAEFSYRFYGRLLACEPLGDALHHTRWALANLYGNPLGLFYSCYADSNLQVSKTTPPPAALNL